MSLIRTIAEQRQRRITAVLGPTNTGKTHLAVERMLGHETGMIGLPLRLLAREVYDRVVARTSAHDAALITGEEKIIPPEPRYYICTVEAMPEDVDVDFLAVDEVQLAADPDRGHVFTDRLLERRGKLETMLLGAETAKSRIVLLLPDANFIARPRLSRLTYAGQKKVSRLPRRSAIVAFSADAVYAIAELVRRQRGGAAVVLGALSPRTRNAQVALYESGDVDYLVATDAIGMGLNMDVDHVAFAALRKFDGHRHRDLTPAEIGQIAGRAGRHMNDGTFGVTADADPFQPEIIERIEAHDFPRLQHFQWRNRALDLSSLDALKASLERNPQIEGLVRAPAAPDQIALEFLTRDPELAGLACDAEAVERLWETCQVPDYRNITGGEHAQLIGKIFRFRMEADGFVPEPWFERQLSYCDSTQGDIDTLANRISHVRTWTFVANRATWLENPGKWQERTRAIEDRLSDALHERLTQRFIDRRTAVLMKRLREKEDLMASVAADGEIEVEGEFIGRLHGFHFVPDSAGEGVHGKTLRSASMKVIAGELAARAESFSKIGDDALALGLDGTVTWADSKVAQLKAGEALLRPRVQLLADDQLSGPHREMVQARIERFVEARIARDLEPLLQLEQAGDIDGLGRGVAFRLVENFGIVPREEIAEDVAALDQTVRGQLRKYGVRFGAFHIYIPALLKPAPTELVLVLWALKQAAADVLDLAKLPAPPQQGLTSVPFDRATPKGFYRTVGFKICGERAVRIDMLERLGDMIRPLVFWKPSKEGEARPAGSVEGGGFTVIPDMMSLVGCSGEEFAQILKSLGFRFERRPAPKPEPAPAPEAGKPEAPEPAAPADAGTESAAAEADAAAPADPAGTDQAGAETAAEAGAEASEAQQTIEVWRPRPARRASEARPQRAPAKAKHRDKADRPRTGKGKGKGKKPGAGKQRQRKTSWSAGPDKSESAPEDSPFAALSELKKAMEKNAG